MSAKKEYHEGNRLSWNAVTAAHNSHKGDQAAFLRRGGTTLFPEERELLGDLRGVSLLHLQCNCGQDSLSLAAAGARVTGVDISDEAIAFARKLSEETGLAAAFERDDVYDWLERASAARRQFDVVFCSYGALIWLSDIPLWARGVAGVLRPGGRLVLVESHPVAMIFDEQLMRKYPYAGGGVITTDGVSDYVGASGPALAPAGFEAGVRDFKNPHPDHSFAHGIGDLLTACIGGGLSIEVFREYDFFNGVRIFPGMRELPGGRMTLAEGEPMLPLMFGLVARRRE